MKKLALFLVLILLGSAAAFTSGRNRAIRTDDEPQFKCVASDASGHDGFDILVTYPKGEPRKCKATCEFTLWKGPDDKTTKSYTYENTVHQTGTGNTAWFGGESSLGGMVLKDSVRITYSSCD